MKKMMVSLLVLAAVLSAAFVPVDRAKTVADNYYRNYAPSALKGAEITKTITKQLDGEATYYVFAYGNDNGFVIVSADDAVRSILGWSFDSPAAKEEDLYDTRNPFANRFWSLEKQIIEARKIGFVDAEAQKEWKDIENKIFPASSKAIVVPALVQSTWDQGYPWNYYTPTGTVYGKTLVGCVATAMSQIMRYHLGTTNPSGSNSYYWDGDGGTGSTISVTFAGNTYDYSLMPLGTSGYTQAQVEEVGELCYHAGVAVDMDYGAATGPDAGSGAFSTDVVYAMETYFGYSTDATYVSVGTVSLENAQATNINNDLGNARPIYWSGSGPDGGHAFILDGRTDDYYYHFNWGWSGSMNGWYKLNALNPGSDFTSTQAAVYQLWCVDGPHEDWPVATNLAASVVSSENVNLTWTRPAGVKLGTLTGYNIYRNNVIIGTAGSSATSYADNGLSQAVYNYYITALYTNPDGESHVSNNASATIVADPDFPIATNLSAVTMGRTSIDLTWTKPYVGQLYYSNDFEMADLAIEWKHERTSAYPPTGAKINKVLDNFNKADITDGWFWCDESSFGDPQYIHGGTYSMAIGYTAPEFSWAFSPQFTISNNDAQLMYWHWTTGNAASAWLTNSYVNLYTGTFTESNPSLNLTEIAAFVGIDETTENTYTSQVVIDLSAYTGTYRIAWVYEFTDGYQMAVDDIIIGTAAKSAIAEGRAPLTERPERHATGITADDSHITSAPKADSPTGYQVYRNGALATTINDGNIVAWSDTGFADGLNEYYVKVVYPTGTSIPSLKDQAYIYANPIPQYLAGVLNANQTDVNLSWYAPLHLPPHWFGFTDDEFEAAFDAIEGMTGTWAERRTLFTAAGLGLGYAYPITVDSLAAAFYEDAPDVTLAWTDPYFQYEVWTTNFAGTADSTIFGPSTNQTAESGFWHNFALPSQLTMNWGWYVSLHVNDNGTPSSFVNVVPASHSNTYYGGDGTYAAGWYSITFGEDAGDWAILCYGAPSVDTWFYNKEEAPAEVLTMTPSGIIKDGVKPELNVASSNPKAMIKYNVWRNGVDIADVTNPSSPISYTDVAAPAGENTYYITAVYSDPAGESVASNSVMVTVPGSSTPDAPTNVVTSVVSGNVLINWDDMSGATSYNVYYSADPYGTYNLLTSVGSSQYTYTGTETKMFFHITSSNSKAAAPKTIEIAKPAKR